MISKNVGLNSDHFQDYAMHIAQFREFTQIFQNLFHGYVIAADECIFRL